MQRSSVGTLVAVVAITCVLVYLLAETYYIKAWREVGSPQSDMERHDQLEAIYAALRQYKETNGEWPAALTEITDAYMDVLREQGLEDIVPFPPDDGRRRVEYYYPPSRGTVLLRSYGHWEAVRGWNLRRDPVRWEIDILGRRQEVPIPRT